MIKTTGSFANDIFGVNIMIINNRRGVIGFMLTMAVGIALGAATLVVTSEMTRDDNKKKTTLSSARTPSSPAAVEKAFEKYQKAYQEYQQAAGLGREDVKKYADAFKEAKRNLEIEILRNTPGVQEMDLGKLEKGDEAAAETSAPAVNTDSTNPFSVSTVTIGSSANSGSGSQSQTTTSAVDAAASQAAAPAVSGSVTGVSGEITGMDYYRVKSGDSLSKICEQFYGASGMWQHILKYQSSSIAATPNLIFPGQLIALPRGLKPTATTVVKNQNTQTQTTTGSTPVAAGAHKVAPAGDESWQQTFQKDYLISDNALTNSGTMTVAQIQRFLESKNSVLAKPYRGSTPAQMIYDAAKKYGINPQVLLTRLQCEQGLISKSTATQKQLDWAVGVGCYDSGNWNQKFKGFDKQIEYAAQTYRRHYDAAKAKLDRGEKVSMNIDGQQVTVKNAATYSFYKYCPHFQGNKLFYDVWRGYRSKF
jgi:nucleoid-associated protein YgaU